MTSSRVAEKADTQLTPAPAAEITPVTVQARENEAGIGRPDAEQLESTRYCISLSASTRHQPRR